jgi:hypothetical protein
MANNIGVAKFTAKETSHRYQDHVPRLANIRLSALEYDFQTYTYVTHRCRDLKDKCTTAL